MKIQKSSYYYIYLFMDIIINVRINILFIYTLELVIAKSPMFPM